MFIIILIIFVLIFLISHTPSLAAMKGGLLPHGKFYSIFFTFVALIMMVTLLKSGLPFIPALAVSIAVTLMLMDKASIPFTFDSFIRPFRQQAPQEEKKQNSPTTTHMSEEEARAILNVTPSASKKEIKQAYHALILKNHPDHGGSSYLATKINQARDRLV